MTPAELTDARQALGLSKSALALLLGVSFTAVWRYEAGQRPIPGPVAHYLTHLVKEHKPN